MKSAFLAALSLMCATAAIAEPARDFEFKGMIGDKPVKMSAFRECDPPFSNGLLLCHFDANSLVGVSVSNLDAMVYNGKLVSVSFTFDTSGYRALKAAFVAKYGPEQKEMKGPGQGQATSSIWVFTNGTMAMTDIGLTDHQHGSVAFFSKEGLPPLKPDF